MKAAENLAVVLDDQDARHGPPPRPYCGADERRRKLRGGLKTVNGQEGSLPAA
jgi:hypothetical protein